MSKPSATEPGYTLLWDGQGFRKCHQRWTRSSKVSSSNLMFPYDIAGQRTDHGSATKNQSTAIEVQDASNASLAYQFT